MSGRYGSNFELFCKLVLKIKTNNNHIVIFVQSYIMNTFEIKYQGNLRTTATHLDSGSEISTDAPKDNHGLGETFSPTDMVCSALASCILTIMAIAVEKNDVDIFPDYPSGTNDFSVFNYKEKK